MQDLDQATRNVLRLWQRMEQGDKIYEQLLQEHIAGECSLDDDFDEWRYASEEKLCRYQQDETQLRKALENYHASHHRRAAPPTLSRDKIFGERFCKHLHGIESRVEAIRFILKSNHNRLNGSFKCKSRNLLPTLASRRTNGRNQPTSRTRQHGPLNSTLIVKRCGQESKACG